jgi:hypothetical protein
MRREGSTYTPNDQEHQIDSTRNLFFDLVAKCYALTTANHCLLVEAAKRCIRVRRRATRAYIRPPQSRSKHDKSDPQTLWCASLIESGRGPARTAAKHEAEKCHTVRSSGTNTRAVEASHRMRLMLYPAVGVSALSNSRGR